MTTMSDEGERTCPLCTEEMDLTDQQLKPCQCGYEICVWCWHHIMDMAEKDDTEGRCPACRTPYDKEKIVGMTVNCERMTELNHERKQKSQKAKSKNLEGRKHLSNVRVIQRNLVYIVGVPNNLADEEILERKEYFGQYGKVLKVSITRPAGGSQYSLNNTCSVYITYAKEEEAVRCIQAVHGFILDGKPLKACYGTTKYCHAWLRNMPCNNPDCLYLHDIGTQEDSFTKDEMVSNCARSQQLPSVSNHLQRRSGSVLPPPLDDFCCNPMATSGKPLVKPTGHTPVSHAKVSLSNGSAAKSSVLPAAASWGLRVVQGRAAAQVPVKLKPSICNGPSGVATSSVSAVHADQGDTPISSSESQAMQSNSILGSFESSKEHILRSYQTCVFDVAVEAASDALSDPTTSKLSPHSFSLQDKTGFTKLQASRDNEDIERESYGSSPDAAVNGCSAMEGHMQKLCYGMSSRNLKACVGSEKADVGNSVNSVSVYDYLCSTTQTPEIQVDDTQQDISRNDFEDLSSEPLRHDAKISKGLCFVEESSEKCADFYGQSSLGNEMDNDFQADGAHGFLNSEASSSLTYFPSSFSQLTAANHSTSGYWGPSTLSAICAEGVPQSSHHTEIDKPRSCATVQRDNIENPDLLSKLENCRSSHTSEGDIFDADRKGSVNTRESNIIENIFSLDFDPFDDPLSSPHDLVKLLLNDSDKKSGSSTQSAAWKPQYNNQSRFSFARQEDCINQSSDIRTLWGDSGHMQSRHFDQQETMESSETYLNKSLNGVSALENFDIFSSSRGYLSSNKVPVNSRSQISAPPGFSVPSHVPPPGFSSQERTDRPLDFTISSANQILENISTTRNIYTNSQLNVSHGSSGDVELIDPAIMAVGKGKLPLGVARNPTLDRRAPFIPQPSPLENDARFHLLMQNSISAHQQMRFPDSISDSFSNLTDPHLSSRFLEQSQAGLLSPFAQIPFQNPTRSSHVANSQWEDWRGVHPVRNGGLVDVTKNERHRYSKYFPAYEEHKLHMPGSGDVYNRAFEM
ncbi:uncharacterized protein LOC18423670 isoform X1 [Amborella trichopoda]|uniref:uncharacterized protein LOC18423670 isoform X1 n=2 Tax=Amborella trichopoda TaxID=13333 RepID=UPI0005D3A62A|nr:uncharacterized protein LOC18423670 isoform X1 [Amborella trichopoda]|eukprot:XP_011627452.1 uncharacterized protein LOC18423670 isoform X1 [Amborella trichopoda]